MRSNIIFEKNLTSYVLQVFLILFYELICIDGRRFTEDGYYPGNLYYNSQQVQYDKINTALQTLRHAPQWASEWPDPAVKLGQVSGVALDNAGRLLVFHRASNTWGPNTFTVRNIYQNIGEPPIPRPTILAFNDTGKLVDMWGQNLFYMPHGITVDSADNVWVTDVALHQVFKFAKHDRLKPAMTLGEKFVPGDDDFHFCKPSAVAVMSTGDFFIADGYCNTRIVKYAPDGTKLLQWGRQGEGAGGAGEPFALRVPHALALAEARGAVCAADREHGRAACFRADNGTYVAAFRSWLLGPRLFGIAYSPARGGRLYVVNGPTNGPVRVRGYVIDFDSGKLIQTFAPEGDFSNPHDVVVSPDGGRVYVAELDPHRVYKFVDESLAGGAGGAGAGAEAEAGPRPSPAKPTATVGRSGGGAGGARRRWEGAGGEFRLRRMLERRRFTRLDTHDSDDESRGRMLPPPLAAA